MSHATSERTSGSPARSSAAIMLSVSLQIAL